MFIKASPDNLRLLKVLDLVSDPIYNVAGGDIEFQVKDKEAFGFKMPVIMKKLLFNPFTKFAFIAPKPHLLEEFDDLPENFQIDFLLHKSTEGYEMAHEGVVFTPRLLKETPEGPILIEKFDYYKIEDDNNLMELIDIASNLMNPYNFFPAIPKKETKLPPTTAQFIYLVMFPYFLFNFINLILSENFLFTIKPDAPKSPDSVSTHSTKKSLTVKQFSERLRAYGETSF